MALGITNRGSGTHNVSALSFTLSPGTSFAAQNSWAVLCVAADNSSTGGATNNFTTVTDGIGNTWTKRQSPVFDNGAANAGVQGAIYTTNQAVGRLLSTTVITVNFGANTVAKTWTLTEVTAGTEVIGFQTGGNKSAGATNTALVLGDSATVLVGEVIIACFYMESGTTQSVTTPDADTTNGTWTTNQYAEIGSTTSGSCIISQGKLQTTTDSVQAYNVTVGLSADYHGSYVILHGIVDNLVTPGVGSLTLTGYAPTVTASSNQLVTPDTLTATAALYVPTVATTANALVVPDVLNNALTAYVITVSVSDNQLVVPDTLNTALTAYVITIVLSENQLVTPDTFPITLTTYIPEVVVNIIVVPDTASLVTALYVPTVDYPTGTVVIPDTGSIAIELFIPTVSVTENVTVTPGQAELITTLYIPTVSVAGSSPVLVTPITAVLILTNYRPLINLRLLSLTTTVGLALANQSILISNFYTLSLGSSISMGVRITSQVANGLTMESSFGTDLRITSDLGESNG